MNKKIQLSLLVLILIVGIALLSVRIYSNNEAPGEDTRLRLILRSDKQSISHVDDDPRIKEIVDHSCAMVKKVLNDAGLSENELRELFRNMPQPGPQERSRGKWEAFEKTKPARMEIRKAMIEQLTALGTDAVPILLSAQNDTLNLTGLQDVFIEAIVQIGKPDVPELIKSLSAPEVIARSRAATALGRIGDVRAVEPLIQSLSDADKTVVGTVARALGNFKDARAVEPLLMLWDKPEIIDRPTLSGILADIGDKRAVEPIRRALENAVLEAQKTGNWNTESWAMGVYAFALGRLQDQAAIPLLKIMLAAPPEPTKVSNLMYNIAESAADALRSFGFIVEGDRIKGGFRIVKEPAMNEQGKPENR